jgi:Carboxypeptidase regulatory-like domain
VSARSLHSLKIMRRLIAVATCLGLIGFFSINLRAADGTGRLAGTVLDPKGIPVAGASVALANAAGTVIRRSVTDDKGRFQLEGIDPGEYRLSAESPDFVSVTSQLSLANGEQRKIDLQFQQIASALQSITVVASAPSSLTPDPAQSIILHDQVLDANPGRPGAPISIPGLPIETASGGIKAPQYFAPGVAGDHGEPIAQFFQVGNFLFPNNLPANAHGNGYADPNVLIPPAVEGVTVDGGAFNVREGNHSVDLAATYFPRQRLRDFVELTGDYRDIDLIAGWSPANPMTDAWIALEASYGNGFLARLEHRQQYKLNAFRQFRFGRHEWTLYGIAYYGFSDIPGLIPIHVPVPGDTIDNRQMDRTSNFLAVASDSWKLDPHRQFNFAGFFRGYSLTLRSDFGGGLIQQSETRTVVGGEAAYTQTVRPWIALLAGVDLRRDAPRNVDLMHADEEGAFQPVTSNNLTLSFVEPFVSLDGNLGEYVHYDVGMRQEELWMNNKDLLHSENSFDRLASLTLPKATLTVFPKAKGFIPAVAFSYGQAFHTGDPRIGTGTARPTLLAPSRAYQMRISKDVKQYQLNVALRRTSNSQELAKIDPDTGLQVDVGPSLNRSLVVSVQRNFTLGAFYVSYAQADARDSVTGQPVPEAPRFIWDAVASLNRLPWRLQVRSEFEFVRAKPLGDGFTGVPVYEFRGAVFRSLLNKRMSVGANCLIASGYTGQTTETIPNQLQLCPTECVVGVPLKSYVSLSWTYYLKK